MFTDENAIRIRNRNAVFASSSLLMIKYERKIPTIESRATPNASPTGLKLKNNKNGAIR
jgi:hypothetical protein